MKTLLNLGTTLLVLAPALLGEEINTTTFDYRITYHPGNTSATDFVSDANAQNIANFYDPATGTGLHQTYIDLGFRAPEFTNVFGTVKPHILLENSGITNNRSNALFPDRIVLVPSNFGGSFTNTAAQCLCGHELAHIVQYQYIPWGLDFLDLYPMGIEGTAGVCEDILGTSADATDDSDFALLSDVYLEETSSSYFWATTDYDACVFWKYMMEQYGTARTEPGVGADALQRFYQLGASYHDEGISGIVQRLLTERNRYTTAASDPGVELREFWQDFTIANRLGGLGLPFSGVTDSGRFTYVDDIVFDESNDTDGGVPVTEHGPLAVNTNTGSLTTVAPRYGASYYTCEFSSSGTNYGVGFFAQSDDSSKVWYTVAGERSSGVIDIVYKGSVHPDEDNAFAYASMQSATDPYVKLHVMATGEDGPPPASGFTSTNVGFSYNFAHFTPSLSIMEPTADYRAYVGQGTAPERFLVKLRVTTPTYLGSGSVDGLSKEQFKVYVETATSPNEATVISAAHVMGEYWLTCQAPVKSPSPSAAQSIIVYLGSVVAAEESAVLYANLMTDQMLVIDRSGSMSTSSGGMTRAEAARAAAQLYIDASGSDDQIGVVTFNGDGVEPDSYADGRVVYSLQQMNSQLERDLVNAVIDETNPMDPLVPSGSTSIGDGLYHGAAEIVANGQPEAQKWILLLSDGHQNEDSEWADQRAFIQGTGIQVETIALGSGVDKNLLQTIADESSGRYYEVPAPNDPSGSATARSSSSSSSSGARTAATTATSGSLPMVLDMANQFLLTSERVHRRERIMERTGTLAAGGAASQLLSLTEGGLTDCVVTLYTDQTSGVGLSITRPDGSTEAAPSTGSASWSPDRYVSYRLPSMVDGSWSFQLTNSGSSSMQYLFVISGKNRQGAQSRVYFTQFHNNATVYAQNGLYLRGLPMPIIAVVTDGNGPVRGATVLATISHPGRAPVTLTLRDDGGAYDGAANDGVYGGLYRATTEYSFSGQAYAEGTPPTITPSYQVAVAVTGKDNLSRNFQRLSRGSFHMYETEQGNDTDGDGMPNRYEALHAGLVSTVNDAAGDVDADGLTNYAEYLLGTDPGLADTDGGGETDGSEVAAASNPWNYKDDGIAAPLAARVIDRWGDLKPPAGYEYLMPQAGQNIILFSVEKDFNQVKLFRSTSSTGPFTLITTVSTASVGGVYLDTGLVNGTTYYYYIQPMSTAGRVATPGVVFSGTPRTNPNPPEGALFIAGGSPFTTGSSVPLRLDVSTVTQMKLANTNTALSSAPWTAFSALVPSLSLGSVAHGETEEVHAIVRDASGGETRLQSVITYLNPALSAVLTGNVATLLDTSSRAASVTIIRGTERFSIATPPLGNFTLPLPAGTCTIQISQRGYQTYELSSVTLAAGSTLNLGTVTLVPLDTDTDGLMDVHELTTHGTNRYNKDTDGDSFSDGAEVTLLMTSPTDPNSLLRLSSPPVVDRTAGTITLTFQSVSGVSYQFDQSPDLLTWTRIMSGGSPYSVTATSSTTTATLPLASGAASRFYRVVVQ